MEYHENKWCISARELVDGGIVSQSNYQNWVNRKRIDVVRRGGGASGQYALVAVDSLPRDYRAKVEELFPNAKLTHLVCWVRSNYEVDQAAAQMMDVMLPQMAKEAGLTEALKNTDPLKWVGMMNAITAQIEEIILAELVYS